jgi:curved DNA-binding protein CbpA
VAVQWVAAQPGGLRDGRTALALLGLAADADTAGITRRYRLLAKLLHPDRLGRAAAAPTSAVHAGGAGPLTRSSGSSSTRELGGAELAARAQEAFTVVAAAYQLLMSTAGGAP